MSSLRVETLRLCWLEAFIAVVDEENISEAARSLEIDQSTVSRYMKALEKWLGKKLIVNGSVSDPGDARISIGITTDGQDFYEVAEAALRKLTECRHENAIKAEMLGGMSKMVSSMQKDRQRKAFSSLTELVGENVDFFQKLLSDVLDDAPIVVIRPMYNSLRTFYNRYEWERNRIKRRGKDKRSTPASSISME